jgi:predicted dehydrogenase
MYPHHVRMNQILNTVADETIMGEVNRIESGFNFMTDAAFQDSNIRARKDGDPHGAIGDLGWYCIRFGQLVFGKLGSKAVSAQVLDYSLTKDGVPLDCTAVVSFENGKSLWLNCGFKNHFRQHFQVCGTAKSILIDDLVLPTKAPNHFVLTTSGLTDFAVLTFHNREVVEAKMAPAHEVLMWKKFAVLARTVDQSTGDDNKWAGDSAQIAEANRLAATTYENQRIVDALMKSIDGDKSVISL